MIRGCRLGLIAAPLLLASAFHPHPVAAQDSAACRGVTSGWDAAVRTGNASRINAARDAALSLGLCPELQSRIASHYAEIERRAATVRAQEEARRREAERIAEDERRQAAARAQEEARRREAERVALEAEALACRNRLSMLATPDTLELDQVESSIDECRQHYSALELSDLTAALSRARLNGELQRWGIDFKTFCTTDFGELYALNQLDRRVGEIARAARDGDSVAQIFQAYQVGRSGRWIGAAVEDYDLWIARASELGNPVAQYHRASRIYTAWNSDASAGDDLLKKAMDQGCGDAFAFAIDRMANYFTYIRTPFEWRGQSLQQIADTGIFLGSGQAACNSANRTNALRSGYVFSDLDRLSLYETAIRLGNHCGSFGLIVSGISSGTGIGGIGPCATDNYDCIRRELRSIFAG
jgi:hypothetical protein